MWKIFVNYTADKQLITKLKSNQLNTMEKQPDENEPWTE